MRIAAALCAVLLLVCTAPAFANIHTSALTGRATVADVPAAGVTVTASSPALIRPRTTITGSNGTYWLDHLPPGTYDVTFSRAGLTTLTRRAVLELARVARADAQLEESEDEESIVSTATDPAAGETQPLTTNFSDDAIDRLPVRGDPLSVARLSPAPFISRRAIIDGVNTSVIDAEIFGQEMFENVSVLRATIPVEVEVRGVPSAIPLGRIRAGGDNLSVSLRDTMSSRSWIDAPAPFGATGAIEHFLEAAIGGALVRQRLWVFASGWSGEEIFRRPTRGFSLKVTAAPAESHNIVATHLSGTPQVDHYSESSHTILHYLALPTPALTIAARLTRATIDSGSHTTTHDVLFAKSSWFLATPAGDHAVTAGGQIAQFRHPYGDRDRGSLFIEDRWTLRRWTVHAGVRGDSNSSSGSFDEISPRVAVTWDLSGNHRTALTASWGEYGASLRETRLGFAAAIGASGYIRADLIRHSDAYATISTATVDAAYRLFDRFEAGANAAVSSGTFDDRVAHVWLGGTFPMGSHEAGVTLLERYRHDGAFTRHATDVALRYRVPLRRVAFTTAADITNVLGRNYGPRQIRIWIRAQR